MLARSHCLPAYSCLTSQQANFYFRSDSPFNTAIKVSKLWGSPAQFRMFSIPGLCSSSRCQKHHYFSVMPAEKVSRYRQTSRERQNHPPLRTTGLAQERSSSDPVNKRHQRLPTPAPQGDGNHWQASPVVAGLLLQGQKCQRGCQTQRAHCTTPEPVWPSEGLTMKNDWTLQQLLGEISSLRPVRLSPKPGDSSQSCNKPTASYPLH